MPIEVRDVLRFDQVRFRGPGALKITQTNEESLRVHAPAYVIKHIISEVKDGVLYVGYKSPKVTPLRVLKEVISFDVGMKDIREISVTGSGAVIVPDLDNDTVRVEINGSGKVNLGHLTADNFRATIQGAGHIRVQGDVETQSIVVNGTGRVMSDHLVSDFAHVILNGSGKVSMTVSDELNVVINGSGEVSYGGFPDITKAITGSGALTRRRRVKDRSTAGEDHG
ncbi:MAG: hypothetical protein HOB98_03275 [Gammaproteobacteria bacterium]|nr:hypothetical protein [Gammaproteobacteria bacterium]MBT3869962.1 hypothetical protein [Gammaproteobacteria bacterium]MBT4379427.1 hypothetical protein [Gammaproteobacteria bacterium]MBT4615450.1 hypothetical protein [Gammaproteobacteria bacterium]MBT5197819.1 hypothetical protein [Gammaproteobacteria bacterium]